MALIILLVLVITAVLWWLSSRRAQELNERIYLKRRGYDDAPAKRRNESADSAVRLLDLLDSLDDVTPYARQRAAEEIATLCESGHSDPRMFAPLVATLKDDDNAAVRGAAADALASLNDARAIEPLRRAAELDESARVRAAALRALEKLGGKTTSAEPT
jgi:HEAT repeat protein